MPPLMIIGFFFVLVGCATVLAPQAWVRMEMWHKRVFWGATLTPTSRSYQYMRMLGTVILSIGFLLVLRGYFGF